MRAARPARRVSRSRWAAARPVDQTYRARYPGLDPLAELAAVRDVDGARACCRGRPGSRGPPRSRESGFPAESLSRSTPAAGTRPPPPPRRPSPRRAVSGSRPSHSGVRPLPPLRRPRPQRACSRLRGCGRSVPTPAAQGPPGGPSRPAFKAGVLPNDSVKSSLLPNSSRTSASESTSANAPRAGSLMPLGLSDATLGTPVAFRQRRKRLRAGPPRHRRPSNDQGPGCAGQAAEDAVRGRHRRGRGVPR